MENRGPLETDLPRGIYLPPYEHLAIWTRGEPDPDVIIPVAFRYILFTQTSFWNFDWNVNG